MFRSSVGIPISIRILILIGLITAPGVVYSTPLQDYYIDQALGRYFTLPQDARSLALGGSAGLACEDSSCLHTNPAGLSRIEGMQISTAYAYRSVHGAELQTHQRITQEESRGYGIVAFPLGTVVDGAPSYGTIAAGFSRYKGETNDQINTTPDGHRRSFAYGLTLNPFALGYSLTFYDDQLHTEVSDLHSHARFLHVIGTQYFLSHDLTLGAIVRLGIGQSDLEGQGMGTDGLSYPREKGIEIGLAQKWGDFETTAAIAYSLLDSDGSVQLVEGEPRVNTDEDGETLDLKIGTEYKLVSEVALRTGVRWYWIPSYEFSRSDLSSLSGSGNFVGAGGGLGFKVPQFLGELNLGIDLGVQYLSIARGSWESQVTLSLF